MPTQPMPGSTTPTATEVGNAPSAAGMLTPQEPSGELEAAKQDVYFATKLLDRAVSKFGKGDDGDAALKARAMLTRHFGDHEDISEEFAPAELKRMLATLAGPGAAGPSAPQPTAGQPPASAPPQQQ